MQKFIFIISLFSVSLLFGQENCNNGIDDDGDGLIDLYDDECICNNSDSSLIPNHSFEEYSCLPSAPSQLNCADNWNQASAHTSDYLNTNSFHDVFNVNPYPLPGGGYGYGGFLNGTTDITGGIHATGTLYKEYIGTCLTGTMLAGTEYTFNLNLAHAAGNPNLNFVVYGSSSCSNLPFSGICPPTPWTQLTSQNITFITPGNWENITITVTPNSNINAIIFGPDCNAQTPPYNNKYNYYYIDGLIITKTEDYLPIEITESGSWCTEDVALIASTDTSGGTWQWYKNNIALVGETNATINIATNNYGAGNYTAKYTIGSNCYIENHVINPPVDLLPDFSTSTSCVENIVAFTDESFTGFQQTIIWEWDFGDGNTSNEENPTNVYSNNGTYDVKLIITTLQGCKDSITKQITVNKTSPLNLNNCNCEDDPVITDVIPNPDFDDHSCCPPYPNYSPSFSCLDKWDGTIGYYLGCDFALHVFPPNSFTNVYSHDSTFLWLQHFGNYGTIIKSCLVNPLIKGHEYKISFSLLFYDTVDLSLYGTSNCSDLASAGGCHRNTLNFELLDSVRVSNTSYPPGTVLGIGQLRHANWQTVSFNFTPSKDIYGITLGLSCGYLPLYHARISLIDNLVLTKSSFNKIEQTGHICSDDLKLSLSASDSLDYHYQWFKDSIELIGETDTTLDFSTNNYGPGNYQLMAIYRDNCNLSPIYTIDSAFIDFNSQTVPTCSNLNEGEIQVRSIIGQGISTPYQFFIDGNGPFTDSNFTNLSSGNHQIIVQDSNLCRDTAIIFVDSLASPYVDFRYDTVCLGNTTIFYDESNIAPGGSINQWQWTIDGNIDNNQNTGHTFSSIGPHDVKLKTTAQNGCIDSISKEVYLYNLPLVDFNVLPNCQFSNVLFTNTTTTGGNPFNSQYVFNWSFDDGTSSNLANPSHTFNNASTFNITLTAVSDKLCVNDTTKPLIIHPKPIADFSSDSVCLGEPSSFTDESSVSSGVINAWKWNIGNLISTNQNPTYSYNNDGTFYVQLAVESNQGCKDTIIGSVIVHPLPKAIFSTSTNQIDAVKNHVEFYNSSQGAIKYYWFFDSIGNSSLENPSFDFDIDIPCRNFKNKLIAETQFGCLDSTFKTINSKGNLLFYIPNSFTPDADGVNDIFKPIFTDLDQQDYNFQIFDRWGTIIFETNDINKGWDGTSNNIPLKQDTYIWKVTTKTVCEIEVDKLSGHINLIR